MATVSGKRVISSGTALAVRSMLELVVKAGGTAPRAQVMGYRIAGKTGTAHKLEGGSYDGNKYVGSFVGIAPISDPRLIVADRHARYFGAELDDHSLIPSAGARIGSLTFGEKRFKELQRDVDGITAKMLSKELKDLEINKLVKRIRTDNSQHFIYFMLTRAYVPCYKYIRVIFYW